MRAVPVAVAALVLLGACSARTDKDVVIGVTSTTATPLPSSTVIVERPTVPAPDIGRPPIPEPGASVALKPANGRPFRPAIEFRSSIPVPAELTFILVVGSDARPGEDLSRTRADSIHLLAVNPRSREGTVLGFPRDAYVEIPGKGRDRINEALAKGGPQLLAETVRKLTGLPVHYYVLTGFAGLTRLVDEVGGVDVYVERRMNDSASGARFERGWHHFSGAEALAYSRNRRDTAYGDFSRSQNQGNLILATLAKMRSEVGDDDGLMGWIRVLVRHVQLDVPRDHLPPLGALARRLQPERLTNVVAPGRVGTAGGKSVVYLTEDAVRLFHDLRDDAVLGSPSRPPPEQSTTSTTSTTTPLPAPSSSTPTTTTTEPESTTSTTAVTVPSAGA